MNKTRSIFVNEIVTIVTRPSYWLATLGLPLVGALIFVVVGAINRNAGAAASVSEVFTGPQDIRPEGYVDLGGIIRQVPESVPAGTLIAYPDEAAARQALGAGDIAAFYIVSADYVQSGEITYIRPDFNPLSASGDQSGLFEWVLRVNLTGGDAMLASLVSGPTNEQDVSLAASPQPDQSSPLAFWLPYGIALLFMMLIMGSSSLLLNNVSKEKENRVMETLLTSVNPRQMLTGKILGLGVVGLGQTLLWLGTSYALLNRSSTTFQLVSAIHLPASFLVWGLVFFVLGYAVYASLMAGLGALAPNLREASQMTFLIMLPLMIPLFLSSSVFQMDPNGGIATGLSLFPLSAPVAMMARLPSGGVPWWQPALAAGLLAITSVLVVRAAAGMFRAQALLSGQPVKIGSYLQALFGKM
jgi:ABC-2 type transport system permease protein